MTETLVGTFNTRAYAEREAASLMEDAPAGVTIVLRINDDATFSLFESTDDRPPAGNAAAFARRVEVAMTRPAYVPCDRCDYVGEPGAAHLRYWPTANGLAGAWLDCTRTR